MAIASFPRGPKNPSQHLFWPRAYFLRNTGGREQITRPWRPVVTYLPFQTREWPTNWTPSTCQPTNSGHVYCRSRHELTDRPMMSERIDGPTDAPAMLISHRPNDRSARSTC